MGGWEGGRTYCHGTGKGNDVLDAFGFHTFEETKGLLVLSGLGEDVHGGGVGHFIGFDSLLSGWVGGWVVEKMEENEAV